MGSLILAVTANTAMIFVMKLAEEASCERRTVILFNYIFGAAAAFLLYGKSSLDFFAEGAAFPLLLGLFNSFLMTGCMWIQQISIGVNGAGISTTYNRLGVLIPTVLSGIWFHEYPGPLKIAGIVLSAAAVVYSYDRKEEKRRKNYLLLGLILTIGGLIDFNTKVLSMFSEPQWRGTYTVSTFVFSAAIMVLAAAGGKCRISAGDLIWGALIGIPNICITFGMVSAAASLPAYIVYPVYSGAVILLVNGIGALVLKEKLTKRETASTAMIAAALVLLNL